MKSIMKLTLIITLIISITQSQDKVRGAIPGLPGVTMSVDSLKGIEPKLPGELPFEDFEYVLHKFLNPIIDYSSYDMVENCVRLRRVIKLNDKMVVVEKLVDITTGKQQLIIQWDELSTLSDLEILKERLAKAEKLLLSIREGVPCYDMSFWINNYFAAYSTEESNVVD